MSLTVVIPVYGSGPYLGSLLSVLREMAPRLEAIILSHSGLPQDFAAAFTHMPEVRVLHSEQRLLAGAARNRGLAEATTEWVAFLDEDIVVRSNWLSTVLTALARQDADCLVGSLDYAVDGGYWGLSRWFFEFAPAHPYLPARQVSTGGTTVLVIKREGFSGFPEDWRFSEDVTALAKFANSGRVIRFEPDIVGYHMNTPGFRKNAKHLYHLGFWTSKGRREVPNLSGALAVRWPVLSLGLWIARIVRLYRQVWRHNGPKRSLVWHTPALIVLALAWNLGFSAEAFGCTRPKSQY
jgi:glycosyltransferase involved in cell wall biosynthesis